MQLCAAVRHPVIIAAYSLRACEYAMIQCLHSRHISGHEHSWPRLLPRISLQSCLRSYVDTGFLRQRKAYVERVSDVVPNHLAVVLAATSDCLDG